MAAGDKDAAATAVGRRTVAWLPRSDPDAMYDSAFDLEDQPSEPRVSREGNFKPAQEPREAMTEFMASWGMKRSAQVGVLEGGLECG